jgi:small nuclear ribonucleoprotein (snRNP)-like protein
VHEVVADEELDQHGILVAVDVEEFLLLSDVVEKDRRLAEFGAGNRPATDVVGRSAG